MLRLSETFRIYLSKHIGAQVGTRKMALRNVQNVLRNSKYLRTEELETLVELLNEEIRERKRYES